MAFIICLNLLISPCVGIAQSMGSGSINVLYPLLPAYMKNDNITLSFCEINSYKLNNPNIHTGTDISVPANQPVFSICDGQLVYDNTKAGYWDSFLIIKHNCFGNIFYAYYGHILSNIQNPNKIKAGEKIAIIRNDQNSKIGDHLHLSISVGEDWDHYGWGYDYSCDEVKQNGYNNPFEYLTFNESNPTVYPPITEPGGPKIKKMRFDVKTKLIHKAELSATKSGLLACIEHSDWAINTEFGEDHSLWISNPIKLIKKNQTIIELNIEIRKPSMISRGSLIKNIFLKIDINRTLINNVMTIKDSQFNEIIEKSFKENGTNLIYDHRILDSFVNIFRQGWYREPTPSEVLEGLVIGNIIMHNLENEFAMR